MTVFEQIKKLADNQGKSLQKVSEDLGLSQNYIYNLKGAKSPAADKLALIADYFHVSVDYLLGRVDYDEEQGFLENFRNFTLSLETRKIVDFIERFENRELDEPERKLLEAMTKIIEIDFAYCNNRTKEYEGVKFEQYVKTIGSVVDSFYDSFCSSSKNNKIEKMPNATSIRMSKEKAIRYSKNLPSPPKRYVSTVEKTKNISTAEERSSLRGLKKYKSPHENNGEKS